MPKMKKPKARAGKALKALGAPAAPIPPADPQKAPSASRNGDNGLSPERLRQLDQRGRDDIGPSMTHGLLLMPELEKTFHRELQVKLAASAPALDVRSINARAGLRALLAYIGEDPDREGLKDTPGRVLKAWRETWGLGYRQEPPALRCFAEKGVDYDEMVVVRSIQFYSTCEHHLAPFFGTCDIGYLPKKAKGVVGLSKLARVVDHFSRRLQVQERLTAQIADHLKQLSPDVAVRMKARHFCMCSRGVMQPEAETTTTALRGRLKKAAARAEFLGGF